MDWRGEQCCNWGQVEAQALELNLAVVTKCDRAVNTSSRPNPVLSNCEEMVHLSCLIYYWVLLKPGNAEHGNTPRSQRTLYKKKRKTSSNNKHSAVW